MERTTKRKVFLVSEELDKAKISFYPIFVVFLIAVAVVLEAINNNLLGLAIPKMMDDWGLAREAFKPAVTAGMIGMAVGAFISGILADKFGRRFIIIMTLLICSLGTALTGLAQNINFLTFARFITSAGFGGLLPVAAATAAEFSAKSWRTMAVTAPIVCIALGTILAGFTFNLAISLGNWHFVFFIGWASLFCFALIGLVFLPESPKFLAKNILNWDKLRHLLRRFGFKIDDNTVFGPVMTEINKKQKTGISALFADGLAGDTIAIWVVSFFGIAGLYAIYMWLPSMLGAEGVSEPAARSAMAYWFSTGGFLGAIICAIGCARFGTRPVMLTFSIGAAATICALLAFDVKEHLLLMSALLGAHGFFNNGIQVPLYAVFANLYPTQIRATGSSVASSIGKVGTIFAGYLGGVLTVQGYFLTLTIFMLIVAMALFAFKRHIAPVVKGN